MTKLFFSYFSIVLLIYLMTKKKSMPSYKALPLSAFTLYGIMLFVFRFDLDIVHAHVLKGLLVAWTPILIIGGAVFLFKTMEATGGLAIIKRWLNTVSDNKVAQLMIVGWAFPFLIEGASGFGTPAAIAAPVLVGLGFPPVRVAILTLIMNSIPVSFGAVGTPTWFGFSGLVLSNAETLEIGFKSALLNSSAAFVIPLIALLTVVKAKSLVKNLPFIYLSILSTIIPYTIIARFDYEFPALIGGAIGMIATILIAKTGFGLSKEKVLLQELVDKTALSKSDDATDPIGKITGPVLAKATFPLWGTIMFLIITRISQLGIKGLLIATEPAVKISLAYLGEFSISAALVIGLNNIFETTASWSHSVLYVPSILPFGLVSIAAFKWSGSKDQTIKGVLGDTVRQMQKPMLALLGALVFVNLMMMGGDKSAITVIGKNLADLCGDSWQFFAAYLGALGSFFSGSNTISNLTFGGIQDSIATALQLNRTTILAMQSVGGSMGNMVCINNIVAVASVLALGDHEGYILKRTVGAMLIYGLIAGLGSMFF